MRRIEAQEKVSALAVEIVRNKQQAQGRRVHSSSGLPRLEILRRQRNEDPIARNPVILRQRTGAVRPHRQPNLEILSCGAKRTVMNVVRNPPFPPAEAALPQLPVDGG